MKYAYKALIFALACLCMSSTYTMSFSDILMLIQTINMLHFTGITWGVLYHNG